MVEGEQNPEPARWTTSGQAVLYFPLRHLLFQRDRHIAPVQQRPISEPGLIYPADFNGGKRGGSRGADISSGASAPLPPPTRSWLVDKNDRVWLVKAKIHFCSSWKNGPMGRSDVPWAICLTNHDAKDLPLGLHICCIRAWLLSLCSRRHIELKLPGWEKRGRVDVAGEHA